MLDPMEEHVMSDAEAQALGSGSSRPRAKIAPKVCPSRQDVDSALKVGDIMTIEENGKRLTGTVTAIVAGARMVQWSDGEITEED